MSKKYKVDNSFQAESVKQKSRDTCNKKYNVPYPNQCPDMLRRSLSSSFHKRKNYTSKDGSRTWSVQGYEPMCLRDLEEQGVQACNIEAGLSKLIPVCPYFFNGKKHKWFPDIWLTDKQCVIEVKADYTYNNCPEIKAKMDKCKYDCEVWIYNRNKLIEVVYKKKDSPEYTYKYGGILTIGKKMACPLTKKQKDALLLSRRNLFDEINTFGW